MAYITERLVSICERSYVTLDMGLRKKKEEIKKTDLTIHRIKHNKGKECVAAKGAKLSSWLLPHSGYKWVEVIQYYYYYYYYYYY